jgi:hypothetical protein
MITKIEVGEVLQRIYDSELNFMVASDWDSGMYFKPKELISRDIAETVNALAEDLAAKYPESDFGQWWANEVIH